MFLFLLLFASSRIIITEVMSNVKGSESGIGSPGDRNEFVEIYNQGTDTIDLISYSISDFDAIDVLRPWQDSLLLIKYPKVRINSTLIYPGSYAVILDPEYTSLETVGGYIQPYDFLDSTLILTVGNTTIGDGLTSNDPLILYSVVDSCTTSFGTPAIEDGFPFDPGDGISWERIDLALPDSIYNWYPSINPSGCTPGRENSTTTAFDLALDANHIFFTPAVVKVAEDVKIEIRVMNNGLRATNEYELIIFDDQNKDSTMNQGEHLANIAGEGVGAFDTVSLYYTYQQPGQGVHHLGFKIEFTHDKNLANNLVFKDLQVVGSIGELALSPEIFSPDADGKDDQLQIDYRLPEQGGELTISIFDARGKRIYDVCKKEMAMTDRGTYYWNGKSSKGEAATGLYIVYLEYRYHNRIIKAKKTTVLAR